MNARRKYDSHIEWGNFVLEKMNGGPHVRRSRYLASTADFHPRTRPFDSNIWRQITIWRRITNLTSNHQFDVESPIWRRITNLTSNRQFDVKSPIKPHKIISIGPDLCSRCEASTVADMGDPRSFFPEQNIRTRAPKLVRTTITRLSRNCTRLV